MFLRLKNFKLLGQINLNSINGNFFLKFIVAVMGALGARKILATPLIDSTLSHYLCETNFNIFSSSTLRSLERRILLSLCMILRSVRKISKSDC
jgi:hypothetical protein